MLVDSLDIASAPPPSIPTSSPETASEPMRRLYPFEGFPEFYDSMRARIERSPDDSVVRFNMEAQKHGMTLDNYLMFLYLQGLHEIRGWLFPDEDQKLRYLEDRASKVLQQQEVQRTTSNTSSSDNQQVAAAEDNQFGSLAALMFRIVIVLGSVCIASFFIIGLFSSERINTAPPSTTPRASESRVPTGTLDHWQDSNASSQVPPTTPTVQPEPVWVTNGHMFKMPAGEAIAPFSVKTSGDGGYYIYLKSQSSVSHDLSFYVRGGSTVEVDVPLGSYAMYYACGTTWYGVDDKFGADTEYYEFYDTLRFYKSLEGEYVWGNEIELWEQVDGNFGKFEISAATFPG